MNRASSAIYAYTATRKQIRRRLIRAETELFAMEDKWRRAAFACTRLGTERDTLIRVMRRIGPVMVRGASARDDKAKKLLERFDFEVES